MNEKVIDFESKERLFEKVESYIESIELFLEEQDKAVPLLLKAFKYADQELKHEIILLLGSWAKQEIAWPLYEILADTKENKDIRNSASIELSVIFPFLKEPNPYWIVCWKILRALTLNCGYMLLLLLGGREILRLLFLSLSSCMTLIFVSNKQRSMPSLI